jgi:hypothetical protein
MIRRFVDRAGAVLVRIFTGPWINWVWRDDRSGLHSDTTLRANLAFLPLYAIVISGTARLLWSSAPVEQWFPVALKFLKYLGPIAGVGVVGYGWKRWSERQTDPSNPPPGDEP